MATLEAERPIPKSENAHPSSPRRSSTQRLLSSLDAFTRDLQRPLQTFKLSRQSKPPSNLDELPRSPSPTQNEATSFAQGSTHRKQVPCPPAVLQFSKPVGSEPSEQELEFQPGPKDPPPIESTRQQESLEGVANDEKNPGRPPLEVTSAPATNISPQEPTPLLSSPAPATLLAQTGPESVQKGIRPFVKREKNLYEAVRLRPQKSLLNQWRTSGKPTIDKRLKDLRLGPNILFNLRLSMMGPSADEKSMKPTILIVCDRYKVKDVENSLKEFVRISFPDYVEFKVIPGSVRLAAGALCGFPSNPGDRTNLEVYTSSHGGAFPFLGTAGSMKLPKELNQRAEITMYEMCTIGGMISIGDLPYGLTVAHSMREGWTTMIDSGQSIGSHCGRVGFYEWSGDEYIDAEALSTSTSRGREPAVAMDWMLVQLDHRYVASNTFRSQDGTVEQNVTGFVRTSELPDDEVWIFSSNPQIGILDSTPSTIIFGQVSYEVFSIALVFPLVLGDSGSWVVKDHKLCGYIFATLDPQPWAYMLSIEPVFDEISSLFSKATKVDVDLPDAATIKSWSSPSPAQTAEPRVEMNSDNRRAANHPPFVSTADYCFIAEPPSAIPVTSIRSIPTKPLWALSDSSPTVLDRTVSQSDPVVSSSSLAHQPSRNSPNSLEADHALSARTRTLDQALWPMDEEDSTSTLTCDSDISISTSVHGLDMGGRDPVQPQDEHLFRDTSRIQWSSISPFRAQTDPPVASEDSWKIIIPFKSWWPTIRGYSKLASSNPTRTQPFLSRNIESEIPESVQAEQILLSAEEGIRLQPLEMDYQSQIRRTALPPNSSPALSSQQRIWSLDRDASEPDLEWRTDKSQSRFTARWKWLMNLMNPYTSKRRYNWKKPSMSVSLFRVLYHLLGAFTGLAGWSYFIYYFILRNIPVGWKVLCVFATNILFYIFYSFHMWLFVRLNERRLSDTARSSRRVDWHTGRVPGRDHDFGENAGYDGRESSQTERLIGTSWGLLANEHEIELPTMVRPHAKLPFQPNF